MLKYNKYLDRYKEEPEEFDQPKVNEQAHIFGGKGWYVKNLIEITKDMISFEKPIEEIRAIGLDIQCPGFENPTYKDIAYHCKVALNSDLSYPIILSEDGRIMDGHHRLLHALIKGHDTILVVQFVQDPEPDFHTSEK